MHDDVLVEFGSNLLELGNLIFVNDSLMNAAIFNGFDINGLLRAAIFEDMEEMHKAI
jgi:hypothetical protein